MTNYHSESRKNLREGIAVFGGVILIYLFMALLTFSPDDPSFFNSHDVQTVINWGGVTGAYIAGGLFECLGGSAYLLLFVLFLFGRILLFRIDKNDHHLNFGYICLGVVLFTISSSALEYLRFHSDNNLPAGSGGIVGNLLSKQMASLFGIFGASLILTAIWAFSISLATGLSWFSFFEVLGEKIEWSIRKILSLFNSPKPQLSIPISSSPPQSIAPTFLRKPRAAPKKSVKPSPTPLLSSQPTTETIEAVPPIDLLDASISPEAVNENALNDTVKLIEEGLASFNVSVKVDSIHPGPVVTRYDLQPAAGVKGAQIVNLSRDLARALSVSAIRVLETIPGSNFIGLEIPNNNRAIVKLSEVLSSNDFAQSKAKLPLALGKTATGKTAIADIALMPHLLVAGSTGSGKSVFINAILLSLLYSRNADELRLLLIDPKMLELASYANIPHLLAPVVTDMEQTPTALNWAVEEMENRYRMMAASGVRHILSYNKAIADQKKTSSNEEEPLHPLPHIVIIIDELADLMMVSGKKVEIAISRLAQKARAAGIHMILATQRPSVDVITGLIKANVPCRLSFQVASKVDSRTILDQMGAESLLGQGDMLYLPTGAGHPQRLHGAFVSDEEVKRVVEYIRQKNNKTQYLTDFSHEISTSNGGGSYDENGYQSEDEPLYDEAAKTIIDKQRVSISMIQRKLRIGYNRAARIVEKMEEDGLVSEMNDLGVRKVLVPKQD